MLSDLKFGMTHQSFNGKFARCNYHKAESWAKDLYGEDSLLAQMLQSDQNWIGTWIAMRIAIEHPSKDKFIETLNFSLEPSRNCRLPTWRFVHPEYDMARPQNLLNVFEACLHNLLKFYEDLQITLLDGHLPSNIKIQIETIPEKDRDVDQPLRYRFTTHLD
jgi:hypothetical protein